MVKRVSPLVRVLNQAIKNLEKTALSLEPLSSPDAPAKRMSQMIARDARVAIRQTIGDLNNRIRAAERWPA